MGRRSKHLILWEQKIVLKFQSCMKHCMLTHLIMVIIWHIFEGVGGREGKGIILIGFCIFLTITRSR
jgi:hypothetical protein